MAMSVGQVDDYVSLLRGEDTNNSAWADEVIIHRAEKDMLLNKYGG